MAVSLCVLVHYVRHIDSAIHKLTGNAHLIALVNHIAANFTDLGEPDQNTRAVLVSKTALNVVFFI